MGYLLPQSTALGSKNYQKKLQAQFHLEDPFWVVTPMPKYDQKSTFDRKVLESPIFNQNDGNRNSKIFPHI